MRQGPRENSGTDCLANRSTRLLFIPSSVGNCVLSMSHAMCRAVDTALRHREEGPSLGADLLVEGVMTNTCIQAVCNRMPCPDECCEGNKAEGGTSDGPCVGWGVVLNRKGWESL